MERQRRLGLTGLLLPTACSLQSVVRKAQLQTCRTCLETLEKTGSNRLAALNCLQLAVCGLETP